MIYPMQLVKNAEPASDQKNIDRNLNKDIQYEDFIFIIKKFWCKMEEVRCKMEERKRERDWWPDELDSGIMDIVNSIGTDFAIASSLNHFLAPLWLINHPRRGRRQMAECCSDSGSLS